MNHRVSGSALAIALVVVAVISVLVAGSLYMTTLDQRITSNDALSTQAFGVAQAGGAYWKAELVSLYMFMSSNIHLYEDDINDYIANGGTISCNNYFAIGLDLDRDGKVDTKTGDTLPTITLPVDKNEGTAEVSFDLRGSAISLESLGRFSTARATVVEEFNISNIDLWNNAVFAADGAANATIRGRAEIRGAVHILGQGLAPTDVALDVTGNFGLGNTYRNLSSSLGINASEMRLTNDDPDDLCATLRVKSGKILMGGSSSIGYKDDKPTDDLIHNMRGIYTNHGIDGGLENQNVFSENGQDAAYDAGDNFDYPELDDKITLANGNTSTWAKQLAENSLTFSTNTGSLSGVPLDDRWDTSLYYDSSLRQGDVYLSEGCYRDLFGTGSGTAVPAPGISFPTWIKASAPHPQQHYEVDLGKSLQLLASLHPLGSHLLPMLSGVAHHRPNHSSGGSSNSGGSNGAAKGFVLDEGSTASFSCKKYRVTGFSPSANDEILAEITWNNSSNEIYIGGTGGVIRVVGDDLTLTGGGGANVEIGYKGEGILFVESSNVNSSGVAAPGSGGTLNLEVDFLPAKGNAAVPDATTGVRRNLTAPNSYPLNTVLGFVARDLIVTSGSQKRYTAAMYAQEGIDVTKQTLVAGAIVTKAFNAGSQVPTVLYVPNLANRIPALMPGAGGNGFSVSNFSWARR